jgi:hypothetical protein
MMQASAPFFWLHPHSDLPCKPRRPHLEAYPERRKVPIWSTGSFGPFGHQGPVPRTPQPIASPAGGGPRLFGPAGFYLNG